MARQVTAFAPGRVNLIGEHTDYNDGLALPFALSLGVTVAATPLPARRIEAVAVDLQEEDSFELDQPRPAAGWRAYIRGAVGELAQAGCRLSGARLRIQGTLPRGAGLASSAALEVAAALALMALSEVPPLARTELARLCSRIENDWVGARTGLLDQLASLHGQDEHALRIDFRTLDVTPVPLALGVHQLVVLDSGESHSNAGGGYNQRRLECERACERLGVTSLREATLKQAEQLPEPLNRRVRHVIGSNTRVDQAIDALGRGDFKHLGELIDRSQASLREDYEVSTPAIEATVERLKEAGALGARLMGGGFGGHVLGLFAPGAVVPEGAFQVRPGAGARLLDGPQ